MGNNNDMDEAPTNAINKQAVVGGQSPAAPKATISLQPKAAQAADDAPTIAVPRPNAGAPKATIRLQPKAAASAGPSDDVPTVSVPRQNAGAPKATIRLQPKAAAATSAADDVPTVSVPRPSAGAPKATIRLQPKSAAVSEDDVPTISLTKPAVKSGSNATVKLNASDPTGTQVASSFAADKTASISKQTIRLVPNAGKGQAGMIPNATGAKPSAPTVKLGGGVKPSAPTVKLGGGVKPSAPTVKLGGGVKPSAPTVKLGLLKNMEATVGMAHATQMSDDNVNGVQLQGGAQADSSILLTIASVASLVILAGSAVLLYMSYSAIW